MKHIFENGRSMVEILGVLAVIGVLSIGGIMGYSYGMDKYRANETLNELQIRIIDYSVQMKNNVEELSLGEMGDRTQLGYPISARISPLFPDYFEVFIYEIPSGVCHRLLESKWTLPYSIFVNTTEYETDHSICDEAEKVTLAYEFKDDLTMGELINEEDRHETWRCNNNNDCKCATCVQGLCDTYCLDGSSCAKDYDNPNSWKCCLDDMTVSGLCCASLGENGECCTSDEHCCPPEKPLRGSDGLCYSCDDETQVNVSGMPNNCAACSNRLLSSSRKYCALKCGLKGTTNENKPLMDKDGGCHACDEAKGVNITGVNSNCDACPNRYLITGTYFGDYCSLCGVSGSSVADKPLADMWGDCYSCDIEGFANLHGITSTCVEICPNRQIIGDLCYPLCPSETPLRATDGKCHDCNYSKSIPLDHLPNRQCQELCPNRKVENGQCILATCPADEPLRDKDGACHACDEAKGVKVTGVNSNCDACPNRHLITGTYFGDYCSLCGVSGSSVADKPLTDMWGDCYSCDVEGYVNLHGIQSTCVEICPNRHIIGDLCYPLCPSETPLRTTDGKCHDCNCSQSIPLEHIPNKQCQELCPNRKVENGKCILPTCPTEEPLMDKDGGCHACDEAQGVKVTGVNSNCDACPNRYLITGTYFGDYCSLCGVSGSSVADKPLADIWGACYSCDVKSSVNVHGIRSTCVEICPNRTLYGDECVRQSCSEGSLLMDSEENCHPCNEPSSIYVETQDKCDVCINRHFENGYCILN